MAAFRPARDGSRGRPGLAWTDRFGDGTPDFLRLTDPADQAAFRHWFTLIADYQAIRPKAEVPAEITDCASLLRYSYREALKRHDDTLVRGHGDRGCGAAGRDSRLALSGYAAGRGAFPGAAGSFEAADATDGAFAQFADAKTLVERNALPREPRRARRLSRAICSFIGSLGSLRRGTR